MNASVEAVPISHKAHLAPVPASETLVREGILEVPARFRSTTVGDFPVFKSPGAWSAPPMPLWCARLAYLCEPARFPH